MTRQLTASSSLESLKKEAKRWLKALRDSDADASARLQRTHDRAPAEPRLREVQHALAVEHGLPNWSALKSAVAEHELSLKGRAERVAEFLRQRGRDRGALNRRRRGPQRNLQAEAALHGFTEMVALLRRYGGKEVRLEGRDAFQAACMRLDRAEAAALAQRHPEYLTEPGPLMAAAATGREDVVALLLELGAPVNTAAGDGTSALHQATWTDAAGVGALLVAHGADVDRRERRFGATPLGWALHMDKPRMADLLRPLSRDVHSLARAGDAERLRAVLTAEPALANSIAGLRRLSPLFCLPERDEERALEVVEVLLAHGADPTLTSGEGFTAVGFAKRQGLDEVADLLEGAANSGARPAR